MIAEDDAAIRGLLGIVVARQGIEVESVANGREALNRLRETHYCLLVLDLMMPVVNGSEVIAGLASCRRPPDVVVVTTAGKPREEDLDPELVSAVVSKPFDVAEFGELASRVIRSSVLEGSCRGADAVDNGSGCDPAPSPLDGFSPEPAQ